MIIRKWPVIWNTTKRALLFILIKNGCCGREEEENWSFKKEKSSASFWRRSKQGWKNYSSDVSFLFVFKLLCSIRFRNYTPKDDSLKEKVDNVVINQKPLSYEEDLKAASSMPSVGIHLLFNCLENRWNQSGSEKT